MPNNCAVYGCKSNFRKKVEGISFFRFPVSEEGKQQWLHLCRRKDYVKVKSARVCSLHFEPSSYEKHLKYELLGLPTPRCVKKLRDDALPTLQLPLSHENKSSMQAGSSSKITVSINNEGDDEKKHECRVGNKMFAQKTLLKTHMDGHDEEKGYECSICNKRFTKKSNCNKHMVKHTGEKKYMCSICNKRFIEKWSLNKHMVTHTGEKKFVCSVCNKRFNQKSNLNKHMVTHTGEKKYECSICNNRFTEKSSLNTHMVLHTGEKKYECSICSKRFIMKSHLSEHWVLHSGERKYGCSICNKRFAQKGHLNTHMDVHSGEKYECDICRKKFTSKRSIKRHMNIHIERKKYECIICKKRFTQEDHLKDHMDLHDGEKGSYHCNLYNENYKSESLLQQHALSHDNQEYETTPEHKENPLNVKKETDEWNYIYIPEKISDAMCAEADLSSTIEFKIEECCEDSSSKYIKHPLCIKREIEDWSYSDKQEKISIDICDQANLSSTIKLEMEDIKTEDFEVNVSNV